MDKWDEVALRIWGETEAYFKGVLSGLPNVARIDFNDPVVLAEFSRRLHAEWEKERGEVVGEVWMGRPTLYAPLRNGTKLYTAPPGVSVPEEPTEEMLAAMIEANENHETAYSIDGVRRSVRIYRAMLAARPNADKEKGR